MTKKFWIVIFAIMTGTIIVTEKCRSNFEKEYIVSDTLRIKAIPIGIVGSKYAKLQVRDIKYVNKVFDISLPSKLYSEKDTLDVILCLNYKGVFLRGEIIN